MNLKPLLLVAAGALLGALVTSSAIRTQTVKPVPPASPTPSTPSIPTAPSPAEEWSIPQGTLVTVVLAPRSHKTGHAQSYEEANMQQNFYDITSVDGHPVNPRPLHVESSGALPTQEATARGYFYKSVAPFSVVPGFSDDAQQGYAFRYDLNLRIRSDWVANVPAAPAQH